LPDARLRIVLGHGRLDEACELGEGEVTAEGAAVPAGHALPLGAVAFGAETIVNGLSGIRPRGLGEGLRGEDEPPGEKQNGEGPEGAHGPEGREAPRRCRGASPAKRVR